MLNIRFSTEIKNHLRPNQRTFSIKKEQKKESLKAFFLSIIYNSIFLFQLLYAALF